MKGRILQFTAPKTAAFAEREISGLKDAEALVQNEYSLISPGTELALWTGTHLGFKDPEVTWAAYPLDAGYASVGQVIESRNPVLPEGIRLVHYGPHGDYTLLGPGAPLRSLIGTEVDARTACFGRFVQIAYSAVVASIRPAGRVLVVGAGIVGNLAAQWFRQEGAARVGIADLSEARLELARSCGIAAAYHPESPEWEEFYEGVGPDTVIEATGSPMVVEMALQRVAPLGQVVLLGSTRGRVDLNVYKLIHRKAVCLSGAHETVLAGNEGETLARGIRLLSEGSIKVQPLITHTIGPSELPGIYTHLQQEPDRYIGVTVNWREK